MGILPSQAALKSWWISSLGKAKALFMKINGNKSALATLLSIKTA